MPHQPKGVALCSLQGKRERQEDAAFCLLLPSFCCIAVADGMGGFARGAQASQLAIEALARAAPRLSRGARAEEVLKDAAAVANGAILQLKAREQLPAVGTTLVAAVVQAGTVTVGHAGDSRIYLISEQDVLQLTHDHSLAQELVDTGAVGDPQAARKAVGGVLLRGLGEEDFPGLEVTTTALPENSAAILLACSDGVHEQVTPADLLHFAWGSPSLQAFVDAVAALALSRGSSDNITAAACEIGSFPRAASLASPVVLAPAPETRRKSPLLSVGVALLLAGALAFAARTCVFSPRLAGQKAGPAGLLSVPASPAVQHDRKEAP